MSSILIRPFTFAIVELKVRERYGGAGDEERECAR